MDNNKTRELLLQKLSTLSYEELKSLDGFIKSLVAASDKGDD